MGNRNVLTVLLAVVAQMPFVDVAQAYYTPGLGRFINRDPLYERAENPPIAATTLEVGLGLSLNKGLNLYSYVSSRPVDVVDPFGLDEMPSQQCQDNGSPVTWSFDGVNLEGWEAVSGLPVKETETGRELWDETVVVHVDLLFEYTTARQQVKDAGPIPQGSYWFDVCKGRDIWSSPWSHGVKQGAWGSNSWSLHAHAGTNTYGRSGFFIHGGQRWGSKGCIDTLYQAGAIADEVERIKKQNCCCCYITVNVNYPNPFVTKSELHYGGRVKRHMP